MKVEERKENRELFALSESMADSSSSREEVSMDRDCIELLHLFNKLKEDDKQKVNSLIKSLLSAL